MLHAYPLRFIEADGHACCFLLLDAFDFFRSSPRIEMLHHSPTQITNAIVLSSLWVTPTTLVVPMPKPYQLTVKVNMLTEE